MQIFACPFCGPRDETEFYYKSEAGIQRPESDNVPAEAWADYLYMRRNPRGETREIWHHLTCGEYFFMARDSVSHEVVEARALAFEKARS
jgi:sarcosine oxidase subunit delta